MARSLVAPRLDTTFDTTLPATSVRWKKNCPGDTMSRVARVAQLDRASVYGTEGYRFESCHACSFLRREGGLTRHAVFDLSASH